MRQKTFGKWLAAAGILMAMTKWMVLPALAAPTVNSIRITFKDKYEDPGVIELVMTGAGAYNAKSGEFLFLPSAERERRRLIASLAQTVPQAALVMKS